MWEDFGKITNNKVNSIKVSKVREKEEISQVDKLKKKLKELIKEENYEEAAKVRDEIKKLDS